MKTRFFKALACVVLAALTVLSGMSAFAAQTSTEPTTEEMERVIKIVKPKLEIPDEASEFSWGYNAGNVYDDASWRFTWQNEKGDKRYVARVDDKGNLENFYINDYTNENSKMSIVPAATIAEYEKNAREYLEKMVPDAAKSFVLAGSYSNGVYSKTYTYEFVREENGYRFPENSASVILSYNTGKLVRLNCNFNYTAEFAAPESVIGEQKAAELLGTKQSMKLTYITVYDHQEDKTIAKAQLVYAPENGYSAVNAQTGEIYDTKSEWLVGRDTAQSAPALKNESLMAGGTMFDSVTEEAEYELNEKEKEQLAILEKLITKEQAIKTVSENDFLMLDPTLSAVEGYLNKSYQTSKSSYQDDSGSYTWSVDFSNPVLNEVKSFYGYANATVNADNGALVSFSSNLRNYHDYINAEEDFPEVKFTCEQAQKIAEDFLREICPEKLENTVVTKANPTNAIAYRDEDKTMPIYGAYSFTFTRVNEGVEYSANRISVGVDGVTGKVYNFNYRWNTNIEFESPKGIVGAQVALEEYVASGLESIYELKTSYIYIPKTNATKLETAKAFVLSIAMNFESDGDIDKVIDKYAKDIDREKLMAAIASGDDNGLLKLAEEYYGVKMEVDEVEQEAERLYTDASDFYDRIEETRLVYTVTHNNICYIDAFTGKGVNRAGEPATEGSSYPTGFLYDDVEGHWAQHNIELLGETGIGFEGGKFMPDKYITGKEFCALAEGMTFYLNDDAKPAYAIKENEGEILRIDAVKYVLTAIDYDKVAVLENIFRTDFADNAVIKEGDIGYVAIAHALGIVHGNGETVRTYDKMTRAEALTLLIKAVAAVK